MERVLNSLNDSQREAVTTVDGSLLILAGAGSGKTKTITSRLAFMIENGVVPSSILTLTFTNKAATQMRQRAFSLIQNTLEHYPLLCTFHKFGLLFLKHYMQKLGRDNSFVIIDIDDKKKILKSFESNLPLSLITNEISKYKNNLIEPDDVISSAMLPNYKQIALLYKKYEEYLKDNNLVDFDDLLILPYKILDSDEELTKEVSQRYRFIMVDEYQDTNDIQFKLLQKLALTHGNICVVGDDDQSIYSWRGANIRNILEFDKHFKNTKVIRLTKNYRSTSNILKAANELIAFNRNRMDKKLEATIENGKEIEVISSNDEKEESYKISQKIKELIENGVHPNDIAILYRINALSRSIEEGLNKANIPYKMVGSMKFYERAEIKDIIFYLRVIQNPQDDFSLKRIINRPKRGIGKTTIDKLYALAYQKNSSVYDLIKNEPELLKTRLPKKTLESLKEFIAKVESLSNKDRLYTLIDDLEDKFSIKDYYSKLPDSIEKVANIDEFHGLFRDYLIENEDANLENFLNDIALQSEQDQIDDKNISVMSIHASKGLEFGYIFIIGLEEGFFPLLGDGTNLEEERRLGYVAITRAKKELYLSYVESRFYKGKRSHLLKSRFIAETGLGKGALKLKTNSNYKKGDLVKHKIFGIGRVMSVGKVKKDYKLTINFGGNIKDIISTFVEKI
jgi:DNA helicase-2/ATP-dependent DNA helicase PcrA